MADERLVTEIAVLKSQLDQDPLMNHHAGKVQSRTEVLARGAGYEIFKVQVRDDFLAHVSSFFRCEADSYRHDVCMHYCYYYVHDYDYEYCNSHKLL